MIGNTGANHRLRLNASAIGPALVALVFLVLSVEAVGRRPRRLELVNSLENGRPGAVGIVDVTSPGERVAKREHPPLTRPARHPPSLAAGVQWGGVDSGTLVQAVFFCLAFGLVYRPETRVAS